MTTKQQPKPAPVEIDDPDAFIEQIAEAVVRRIDERDKINLIADAVLEQLSKSGGKPGGRRARAGAQTADTG